MSVEVLTGNCPLSKRTEISNLSLGNVYTRRAGNVTPELVAELRSAPMFHDAKVYVFDNPTLSSCLLLPEDGLGDNIAVLVFDKPLDNRTKGAKYIRKHFRITEMNRPQPRDMKRWVRQCSPVDIADEAVDVLVDTFGTDTEAIVGELRSLSSDRTYIAWPDVEHLARNPHDRVYELIDALLLKDHLRFTRIYTSLTDKQDAKLSSLLIRQTHTYLTIKCGVPSVSGYALQQSRMRSKYVEMSRISEVLESLLAYQRRFEEDFYQVLLQILCK